jgi:hypothetical protein
LRDESAHGNRQLFLDDMFVTYLLAFLSSTIRLLRSIEGFSQTVRARKHVSLRTICRSTRSDFNQLANPERWRRSGTLCERSFRRAPALPWRVSLHPPWSTLCQSARCETTPPWYSSAGARLARAASGVPRASDSAVCNLQNVPFAKLALLT